VNVRVNALERVGVSERLEAGICVDSCDPKVAEGVGTANSGCAITVYHYACRCESRVGVKKNWNTHPARIGRKPLLLGSCLFFVIFSYPAYRLIVAGIGMGNYMLIQMLLTPAFYVGAMYVYTRTDFNSSGGQLNPSYQSVGLMGDYLLSKRTDAYVQGVYQHVGGDRTGTVLDVAYIPGADGVSSGGNQVVVRVALRHKF